MSKTLLSGRTGLLNCCYCGAGSPLCPGESQAEVMARDLCHTATGSPPGPPSKYLGCSSSQYKSSHYPSMGQNIPGTVGLVVERTIFLFLA